MATVILVMIGFAFLLVIVLSMIFGDLSLDFWMVPVIVLGLILGFFVANGIGFHLPTVTKIEPQPIISIYTNQNQNEIYLRVVNDGNTELLYKVMDNGVPRDRTLLIGGYTIRVAYDNVDPYVTITTTSFAKGWYSWFGFLHENKTFVFYVPETGVDADINSFLK